MIVGIDVGGTKTVCAIGNERAEIIEKIEFSTPKTDPETFFRQCVGQAETVAERAGVVLSEVNGIGLSLPGMVDRDRRLIHAPFLGWRDVDVIGIVRDLTGVKRIRCDRDVNTCALAESRISGRDRFLWVTVSTGIGGTFVINGKIDRGSHAVAGEIGHTKVEYRSPKLCTCGCYGCAEAHASGTALTRLVREKCETDADYADLYVKRRLTPDAAGCSVLARSGEKRSLELFGTIGGYLGRALANAIALTDPGLVFLGGGMARSFDLLIDPIRKEIDRDCLRILRDTEIRPTALGYDAALIGAMSLI